MYRSNECGPTGLCARAITLLAMHTWLSKRPLMWCGNVCIWRENLADNLMSKTRKMISIICQIGCNIGSWRRFIPGFRSTWSIPTGNWANPTRSDLVRIVRPGAKLALTIMCLLRSFRKILESDARYGEHNPQTKTGLLGSWRTFICWRTVFQRLVVILRLSYC